MTDIRTEPIPDLDQPSVVDSASSPRFPVYTRANVAEVFPGPVSPLGYTTLAGSLFNDAWRKALIRFGAFDDHEFDWDNRELLGVFYGYPYLNVSVQRVFGYRMPGATTSAIDESFFGGGSDDVPPYEHDPLDDSPRHTDLITETIQWALTAPELETPDRMLEESHEIRRSRPDFDELDDSELFEYALPLITDTFAEINEEHMFVTSAGSIPIGAIHEITAAVGRPELANAILSSQGGVVSAEPAWALWDLGRFVAGSENLTGLFDEGTDAVHQTLRTNDVLGGKEPADLAEFRNLLGAFIDKHGARAKNEMDLREVSWDVDHRLPLIAIDRLRLQSESASPRNGFERLTAARQAAVETVRTLLADDPDSLTRFEAAVRSASVFLPAREKTKLASVNVLNEGRLALREIGSRAVADGIFTSIEDFVMLTVDEFPAFLTDRSSWSEVIGSRRRHLEAIAELEPPFITVGTPNPPSSWPRRREANAAPLEVDASIQGIGVCPGTAVGRARIVLDPDDADLLAPGEILVAPHTDPSWTPLFPAAAGVVVDVGAPLSHAAIVSRELGVPCVVSALHASKRIRDGSLISVDGSSGTVRLLEPPSDA